MTCTVCGGRLDEPPAARPAAAATSIAGAVTPAGAASAGGEPFAGPPLPGAALHAGCFAGSVPGDLLAVFTTVAAMVLAPMIVVWGG